MTLIISLRGEDWVHKISLNPPRLIEVSVPSQESEESFVYVFVVSILPFSIGFWNCSDSVIFSVFHFIV